jgi:hypothetical protein
MVVEKVPASHRMQLLAPIMSLYDPALQFEHTYIPVRSAYCPETQFSHPVAPICGPKVPSGHPMQADAPEPEKNPAEQS